MDTDSSEDEGNKVLQVSNNKISSNSSTGEYGSPGSNVDMYTSATVKNSKEIEKEQVLGLRDESNTMFSTSQNNKLVVDFEDLSYAIEDVVNIDNIDFDDTDNSLLDDSEEVQEWE